MRFNNFLPTDSAEDPKEVKQGGRNKWISSRDKNSVSWFRAYILFQETLNIQTDILFLVKFLIPSYNLPHGGVLLTRHAIMVMT